MQGKVALITGGARGIGRAICETLLKRGAKVTIVDINSATGEKTKQELRQQFGEQNVEFIKCDVTSDKEFQDAFLVTKQKFGAIDMVCNNAGYMHEIHWKKMLEINLLAVIRGTLLGIEHMGVHNGGKGGVVVNIASVAGLLPMPFGPAYAASKTGVVGLSRSFGLGMSPRAYKVRVNCLCPSFTDTDMMNTIFDTDISAVYVPQLANKIIDAVGKMKVDDVAESIVPLFEDQTLSGAVMTVTPAGSQLLDLPKTVDDLKTKL